MPIQYAGGTNVNATFTGATRQDILSNLKTQLVNAGWTNIAQASAQGPGNVGNFTVTIATPGVVTFTSHGFLGGERVVLQTTGALPTGLSVNTVYFVKYVDANTFNLATTSGGSNINTTGSQSGTHTLNAEMILLQSAATSQSLQINVRLKDNRGSCVQISIENTGGTLLGQSDSTHGGNLLPAAAQTFRVIANRYQFFCFVPGVYTTPRKFAGAGVPYIPAPNSVPAAAGWMVCDSVSDTDTSSRASWRTGLKSGAQASAPSVQMMWGSTIWETGNNTGPAAVSTNSSNILSLIQLVMGLSIAGNGGTLSSGQPALYRWANNDIMTSDPLLAWGLSTLGDEPLLRAQLWDALAVQDSFTGDTTTTFDSHNWFGLTHSNIGSGTGSVPTSGSDGRGTLFLVTP